VGIVGILGGLVVLAAVLRVGQCWVYSVGCVVGGWFYVALAGVFSGFWVSEGVADRGFVWASKREAEKWHTETRSNLGDFCLARS